MNACETDLRDTGAHPGSSGSPKDGGAGRRGIAARLARRFGYMVAAQWGSGLLMGLFMILLARSGPDTFGLLSLAIAMGALVTMITGAGFDSYLVPKFTERRVRLRRTLAQALLLQMLLLLFSLAMLTFVCFLLGHGIWKSSVILLVSAGMGAAAMANSFFVLCRVRGRQDTEMRIRLCAGFLASLFGIACLLLDAPIPLLACFKLVEALMQFIGSGLALRWRLEGFPVLAWRWISQWRQGFLFAGIAVCGLLYNKLNIYILDLHGGTFALGLYSAPWEIVDGLSILVSGTLLEKVLFPHMAVQWRDDRLSFMALGSATGKCLLVTGLAVSYVLFVEADRLLVLIFGSAYEASTGLLRAQLPCITAAFLHNFAACLLICMRRYQPVLYMYLSGLVCNSILCAILIPGQGALGAAWAISGTKVWMMILSLGFAVLCGLKLRPGHVLLAIAAAAAAWGIHALCLPYLPREAAECLGLLPLLVLAWLWVLPALARNRKDIENP